MRTVVPGLDLRLGTAHDGLNVGWSSVVTAVPEASTNRTEASPDSPLEFRLPLSWQRRSGAETRQWGWFISDRQRPTNEVRFVQAGHAGLALGFSRQLKGLEFGFGRQTWIVAPTNSHGTWTLSFRSGANGVTRLEEQTTNQIKPE